MGTNKTKKWLAVLLSALAPAAVAAGGAGITMERFPQARTKDLAALQNGARLFANYCLNCHSASLMRWNRLTDIGIDERQIRDFLIFGDQKVGDLMTIAMRPTDAKAWFGKVPPDLSVIVRARTSFDYRGTDYLYTLLRGYYRDAASPTGWNNVAYPSIAMPHVFWERQGPREATIDRIVYEADEKTGRELPVRIVTEFDATGHATETRTPLTGHPAARIEYAFRPADARAALRFDNDVADLVAYLAFMTDPSAASRVRIGVWVLLYLGVFSVFAWRLNAVFWKDVK